MPSVHFLPSITINSLIMLLLLIVLPWNAHSQVPTTPSPSVNECVSQLLPLSPCAPFVQGTVRSPAQMCCVNLKQVYSQHSGCLCLLLNSPTLSNMPINSTLALQLPVVCGLEVDDSTCSGGPMPVPPSPTGSPVSIGSTTNPTVAASPMVVPGAPRPASLMAFGLGSAGTMLKIDGHQLAAITAGFAILFAKY